MGLNFEANSSLSETGSPQESCWMKLIDPISRFDQCRLNPIKSTYTSAKKRNIGGLSVNSILAGERFLIKEQLALLNFYSKLYGE